MKTSIKTLACAIVASIAFLACNNTGLNGSVSSQKTKTNSSIEEIPAMDNRVVSYQRYPHRLEYSESLKYGDGFIAGKDTLKSWFPHIFNDEQIKSECNYFAIYFTTSSTFDSYHILSKNMNLYLVQPDFTGKNCDATLDIIYEAILVCDDKAGTLIKSINLDSIRTYISPNWDCESGIGAPDWGKIYF